MGLKNLIPEKMQTGGTLPFARQRVDPGPRNLNLPAFVTPPSDTTGPTIGLPGQDPIDAGPSRTIQPIFQDEVRIQEANKVEADVDSDIFSLYNQQNQQAAFETAKQALPGLTNVSWENMTQEQKQPYLDRAQGLDTGQKAVGFVGNLLGAVTGLPAAGKKINELMLKSNQKRLEEVQQKGIMVPSGPTQTTVEQTMPYSSQLSQLRSSGQLSPSEYARSVESYRTGLANQSYGQRSMVSPTLTTPMQQFRAADQASMETFDNVTPEEARDIIDDAVKDGATEGELNLAVKNGVAAQNLGKVTGRQAQLNMGASPDIDASPKVICAELYRQGLLEKEIFELDEEFGRHLRKVDPDIINGYHQWALPLVSLMQRSIVASHIIKIIARPVVKHIAYQMGYPSKTYLGHAMFTVGKYICRYKAKKDIVHA